MIASNDVTTLAELPRIVCRYLESKTAVIADDARLTYGELDRRSNAMAHCLLRDGIGRGDRVAVLARDSAASIPLLFATAKARAVWAGLNFRLSADEIAGIIEDARPKVVFVDAEFAPTLQRSLEQIEVRPILVALSGGDESAPGIETWTRGASQAPPTLSYDPEDVVVQLYTSGTTGLPKGVQLPNRSFFAVAREMAAKNEPFLGWTSADVSLLVVPTFYVAALWWLVRGLALGSTNVVLKAFDAGQILKAIPEHGVTKIGLVPAMLQMILAEPGFDATDLSSLRTIFYGGSPIAPALLERAMKGFGCDFVQAYGMTETGNVAICLGPEEHQNGNPGRLFSAGRPLHGVTVKIIRRDGSEAAAGEPGEIAIHSPARMAGYWNLRETTAATLVDGWVMTGDVGYVDADGYVFVVDRKKDMIISAGQNIYPAEIEKVVRAHPDVADVAVIGIPHELWGEAVLAFVVPRVGTTITRRDVVLHARGHLADYKAPSQVEIVAQLPRNANGKVLKTKLREPFWQGRERQVN
jgi:acyl-CoA synthetase (AMP-forming)/AMP-acid ligase II